MQLQWIAASNKRPVDRQLVLFTDGKRVRYGRYFEAKVIPANGYYLAHVDDDEGEVDLMEKITHWMPLPKPPHA